MSRRRSIVRDRAVFLDDIPVPDGTVWIAEQRGTVEYAIEALEALEEQTPVIKGCITHLKKRQER